MRSFGEKMGEGGYVAIRIKRNEEAERDIEVKESIKKMDFREWFSGLVSAVKDVCSEAIGSGWLCLILSLCQKPRYS